MPIRLLKDVTMLATPNWSGTVRDRIKPIGTMKSKNKQGKAASRATCQPHRKSTPPKTRTGNATIAMRGCAAPLRAA